MTRSAGLTTSSRHEPQTFRRTTRVPGAGPATPDQAPRRHRRTRCRDWLVASADARAAAHDVHVARMNRRRSHADENFAGTGFRFRQFSNDEDGVWVAGAFKKKVLPKCSPVVA